MSKSLILVILTICILSFLFVSSILKVEKYTSHTQSMEPTIHNGSSIFVRETNAGLSRGDIVLYVLNNVVQIKGVGQTLKIGRIIGLPNEVVHITKDGVYINNLKLDERYVVSKMTQTMTTTVWTLGADEFFVMGDNRDYSLDSRNSGPVKRSQINAKEFCILQCK